MTDPTGPSPFGRLLVVLDPRAGGGLVGRESDEIERQLRARRLAYRLVRGEGEGAVGRVVAEALADDAGERFVTVAGGDRAVHEAVNAIVVGGRPVREDVVLGVIAPGDDCDFVKTFGLRTDVVGAVRHLVGDGVYPIDVGVVRYTDPEGERGKRYFGNLVQAGLGAAVTARAGRMPRWLGRGGRLLGFWTALARYRPADVRVSSGARDYEGKATGVVVANGQFASGGLMLSPRSWPGDGYLDAVVATGPKSDAFRLMPDMMIGEHLDRPGFVQFRAKTFELTAEPPLPLEVDGQVVGRTPADFSIVATPFRLKV